MFANNFGRQQQRQQPHAMPRMVSGGMGQVTNPGGGANLPAMPVPPRVGQQVPGAITAEAIAFASSLFASIPPALRYEWFKRWWASVQHQRPGQMSGLGQPGRPWGPIGPAGRGAPQPGTAPAPSTPSASPVVHATAILCALPPRERNAVSSQVSLILRGLFDARQASASARGIAQALHASGNAGVLWAQLQSASCPQRADRWTR